MAYCMIWALGFVVNNIDMVARTEDGGATWDTLSHSPYSFNKIAAFDPSTMCGYAHGPLMRSTDGGQTFSWGGAGLPGNVHDIHVLSSSTAWMASIEGYFRTTNAGVTWEQRSDHARGYDIDFINPEVGAVISNECIDQYDPAIEHLWITTDGGSTWSDRLVDEFAGSAHWLTPILFDADDRLFMRGDSCVMISADHGETWVREVLPDGRVPASGQEFFRCGDKVIFWADAKLWRKHFSY